MNDNHTSVTDEKFFGVQKQYLIELNAPLQKKTLFIAGPVSLGIHLTLCFLHLCWQTVTVLLFNVFMITAWIFALRIIEKNKDIPKSISIFVLSIFVFILIMGMLVEGSETVVVLASLAVVIYGSLFSKRQILVAVILAAITIFVIEFFRLSSPFEPYVLHGLARVIYHGIFALMLAVLISQLLVRGQIININLFQSLTEQHDKQTILVETINRAYPAISTASGQIRRIATQLSVTTHEQAVAATQINAVVVEVNQSSQKTASISSTSQKTVEKSKNESTKSNERLAIVTTGFGKVVSDIESARTEVSNLAENILEIEEIFGFNLEISGQIKILAVNAAVQAAGASKYGKGFRLVANSLKEMIRLTDTNLDSSAKLLDNIRLVSKESAGQIDQSADELQYLFSDLKEIVMVMETNLNNVIQVSSLISRIAEAASSQQTELLEIRNAISDIDQAANQLNESSKKISENIKGIVETQQALNAILSA
jgi:methyl-accepting chemotaxis protein